MLPREKKGPTEEWLAQVEKMELFKNKKINGEETLYSPFVPKLDGAS